MTESDLALLRKWQGGDAAAFEGLVRRWQEPVGRFVFHMTGRREDVDDLSQEVFLRVYLAGRRFRPEAAFSTWLYRIALNVVRDSARNKRSGKALFSSAERSPDRPDPQGGPEQAGSRQEVADLVTAAVAELPEDLRTVVVLRHYQDMKFEEIGRVTGTPASTLKSRFAAALAKLRKRLVCLKLDEFV